jgi:hypothetical protein
LAAKETVAHGVFEVVRIGWNAVNQIKEAVGVIIDLVLGIAVRPNERSRDVDVGDHLHLRPVSHGKPILGKKDRDPRVGFSAKRFLVKLDLEATVAL